MYPILESLVNFCSPAPLASGDNQFDQGNFNICCSNTSDLPECPLYEIYLNFIVQYSWERAVKTSLSGELNFKVFKPIICNSNNLICCLKNQS